MKLLKTFEHFFTDRLFEDKFKLTIGISERLKQLLLDVNHDIAKELLLLEDNDIKSDKITLIDYDDDDYTKFTYTVPNKIVDLVSKKTNKDRDDSIKYLSGIDAEKGKFIRLTRNTPEVWEKFRVSASIPKVIEKIFPGKYDASKGDDSRESFKNIIVAERKKELDVFNNFKIVSGGDIIKYYHEDNYAGDEELGGQLYKSCMRHDECSEYLSFYAANKDVQMVILLSSNERDKIIGRALLWNVAEINGEEVDRKFMDRIYTIKDEDVYLFKDLAEKNEWLYKDRQNMYSTEDIVDLINNEKGYLRLKTPSTFKQSDSYPYMDTLKYYYFKDGYLSNFEDNRTPHYILESTDGDHELSHDDRIYVEYYDDYFGEDDDDLIYCEYGDEYRLIDDAVEVRGLPTIEFATKEYAERHLEYSEYLDEYYLKEDVVWSDYHNSYVPKKESIFFYTNGASEKPFDEIYQNPHFTDYTMDDDKYIIQYYKHNMYFDIDEKDNFMFVKSLLKDGDKKVWAHKKWDNDKIFIMDGEYWIHDSTDEDFYSLKGNIKLLGEKKNIIK